MSADAGDGAHALLADGAKVRIRPARPLDLDAVQQMHEAMSQDNSPELAELEVSPVIARPDGAFARGASVRVTPAPAADPFIRQLRGPHPAAEDPDPERPPSSLTAWSTTELAPPHPPGRRGDGGLACHGYTRNDQERATPPGLALAHATRV